MTEFILPDAIGLAGGDVWSSSAIDVRQVFQGLEIGGVSGKEIAHMTGVAPSTVSKWRKQSAKPAANVVQYLTLVLADVIQTREGLLDAMEDVPLSWRLGRESELAAMRQALKRQEQINNVLPAAAIRDGARLFKEWLMKRRPAPGQMPAPATQIRVSA